MCGGGLGSRDSEFKNIRGGQESGHLTGPHQGLAISDTAMAHSRVSRIQSALLLVL